MLSDSLMLEIADIVAKLFELAGIGVIVIGAVFALLKCGADIAGISRPQAVAGDRDSIAAFRKTLGRSILTGLELLVAADIIRTVAVEPTMENVLVLGVIVLIRTFLSFSLEVEIDGKWPWQHAAAKNEE
ncbi:hypothetical protein CP97_11145 [Aurantiacibacter atlanticus]|uniref:DUF1622 domain-containing protein n=1 Tax=Aurantiacibacter atlanticus TaxID=1648404 RepID=A0A0H4VK74_9SPHN|nr:DUF1622 domain-containing protein [Aurantiacibacter atlanticus]AKQ43399.2 hypothetical protein CP97_11145 [Aurantiacibacter atlanticus]MDF1834145.1 DUF1622 domain-containing protein [Alteraurantiacibacter sp. bin_em_oilr2.035]